MRIFTLLIEFMDYCEICGAPIKGKPYLVYIEGAKLKVCEKCAKKADSIIEKPYSAPRSPANPRPNLYHPQKIRVVGRPARPIQPKPSARSEAVLVYNYGEVVRQAREKRGITIEQLAKKINEKESVIRRVEDGKLRPPEALIDKLESELLIKIRGVPPPSPASPKPNNTGTQFKDVAKLRD